MSCDPIILEFDNHLDDHLSAERLYYQSTFWSKGDKVVAVVLSLVGVFWITVVGIRWWTLVWFPLAIAEWFSWLDPYRFRVRFFFRRNPKFLETCQLTFSDAGIHFKTKSIESDIAWTHYHRMLENQSVILLLYGTWMYTVIPTRAFRNSGQLAALRSLLSHTITQDASRNA